MFASNRGPSPCCEDHKPNAPTEKQRIEAAGGRVECCGPGQYRVNGNLNLSRALGDLEYKKDRSLPPEKQIICSTPDVTFRVGFPSSKVFSFGYGQPPFLASNGSQELTMV
ncbi:unnamed protein product [Effrenium voratum]|nr:unnamed protein product [Effrenium voratum]